VLRRIQADEDHGVSLQRKEWNQDKNSFEVGGNGALYRAYISGGSQKVVAQLTPDGQFHYQHTNHLGSVHKMTSSSGAVVYRGESDSHGNVLLETGNTTLTANRFTICERDSSELD
jgi:uncharacterized protein RhaS with RHS repeats